MKKSTKRDNFYRSLIVGRMIDEVTVVMWNRENLLQKKYCGDRQLTGTI